MCGRFYFFGNSEALQQALPGVIVPHAIAPRFNIAPGQPIAVVVNRPEWRIEHFLWGLVPSWAKDPGIGHRLINARAETLADKPSFRAALRRRRCLIFADGFYEWHESRVGQAKIPMVFRLHPPRMLAFAGLWEVWQAPDGSELMTVAIITTAANPFVARYHQRMPVILDPAVYAAWLNPEECSPAEVSPLLQPVAAEAMEAYPVSTLVNNVRNDVPACLEPTGDTVTFSVQTRAE